MNKKLTYLENLVKLDCERKFILRKIKILEKRIIKITNKIGVLKIGALIQNGTKKGNYRQI